MALRRARVWDEVDQRRAAADSACGSGSRLSVIRDWGMDGSGGGVGTPMGTTLGRETRSVVTGA
ncbi:hypothetical protein GCM10009798_24800 [Nocardioides panacihumi]|uniref:Uncharacterized protein n=1 Tax=Nocardioides panacihumi TaxID=400774 RepID=A0ABN2R5K9_9ACTN